MKAILVCLGLALVFIPASRALEPSTEQTQRMLSTIVLPSVDFHHLALEDAVEFLRQDARRCDPAGRGLNIFLQGGANRTPVTLNLAHVPLGEALRYLTMQAGMKVRVEPYAVSLVPLSDPDAPLVMKTFRVPPTFFGTAEAQ